MEEAIRMTIDRICPECKNAHPCYMYSCFAIVERDEEITRQRKLIEEYREALGKIAEVQHLCRMLEFRERCVFCEAKEALANAKTIK